MNFQKQTAICLTQLSTNITMILIKHQ